MNRDEVDRQMAASLREAVSHRVGAKRFGRDAIPGKGRAADAMAKLAGWISGSHGVASHWSGAQFEADLSDRIRCQKRAGVRQPHVRECFDVLLEP